MTILLDTCAAIWAVEDTLSEKASELLSKAYHDGEPVYVSPITAWEIGLLMSRGRLVSPQEPQVWFARLLAIEGVRLAEMSPRMLIASSYLPGETLRDPADRILVATARAEGLMILTRDRLILDYADAGHVTAHPC